MDMRGMIKILNEFYSDMPPFTNVEEVMDMELTLVLKMKSIPLDKHEVVMTLYYENGLPFSLTVNYDMKQIQELKFQDQTFCYVRIPLRTLMLNNLALLIKVVEKRRGKGASPTANVLHGGQDKEYYNRVFKCFTILPLSRFFWVSQLKVKQLYEIREA